MATNLDYAVLAANVYGNSSAVRDPRNVLPDPAGWSRLTITPAEVSASGATPSGFMASAHRSGSEIVISFNRPASVFDMASFEKSADSTTTVSALDAGLRSRGYSSAELGAFTSYIGGDPLGLLIRRRRQAPLALLSN